VAQKRFVIVAADPFFTIEKDLVVSEFSSGLPDDVHQPRRARSVTTELKVLVTYHIEQNQRRGIYQFIFLFQQRYVVTASIRVVRPVFVFAIAPTFTKRLFAVEKYKPVRYLRFFFRTSEHSSDLEQRRDRRRRIIRTDEAHVFVKLRVVVTTMMFTIFFSPSGVVAVNSSSETVNPDDLNSFAMYARVFSSSGEPGGRGPKSICFRTWSIARSPLKPATGDLSTVTGRRLVEIAARGLGGGSFFGHALKRTGMTITIASNPAR
jgi:hypothetical protein